MPVPPILAPHGPRRRFLLVLGIICLAALAWRVGYVFWSHPSSDGYLIDEGDAFYYAVQADQLSNGHGFYSPFDGTLAADHPPLTIIALAPVAMVFGGNVLAKRLAMAVLGTVVVAVVGLLGRRVGRWGAEPAASRRADRIGWAAAAIAAANPNLWMNDALVMSETLAALLYAVVFLLAYRIIDAHLAVERGPAGAPSDARVTGWTPWAGLGVVIGLCALTRAEALLLVPLLVLPLAWWCRRRAQPAGVVPAVSRLVLAGVLVVAVVAPWSIYISSRYDRPVTLSTNDGLTLWGANCPETYFGPNLGSWSIGCVYSQLEPPDGSPPAPALAGNEADQASGLRDLGIDYATSHKSRWPQVLVARQGRTWGVWNPSQQVYSAQGEGRPTAASWAGLISLWVMVPVAAFGAYVGRGRPMWPLASAIVLVVVTSALFYGIARFRIPADVALTVLVGVALGAALDRWRSGPDPIVATPVAGATA
ncbi:hypothetical protein BH10ACT1_BH10ACT1_41400 [soil metagenome]